MRPDAVAEVNIANDFSRRQIDDQHLVSINARLSHPGASINRHKGGASVPGDSDFITVNARGRFGDGRDLPASRRIDDTHIGVSLVDDQQSLCCVARRLERTSEDGPDLQRCECRP